MIILIIRVYLTSILMHNQIDSGHLHSLHKDNWAVSEQLKPSLLLLLWAVCIVGFSRVFLMCREWVYRYPYGELNLQAVSLWYKPI